MREALKISAETRDARARSLSLLAVSFSLEMKPRAHSLSLSSLKEEIEKEGGRDSRRHRRRHWHRRRDLLRLSLQKPPLSKYYLPASYYSF